MIHASYEVAKKVFNKSITRSNGLDILELNYGMNRSSADFHIGNYKCLVTGKVFRKTMNVYATRYYLNCICAEGNLDILRNAVSSLYGHIKYYEIVRKINVVQQRKIYEEFAIIAKVDTRENSFPEEVNGPGTLLEGKVRSVNVNIYERNPVARTRCIEYYGCTCYVCGFDFSEVYGKLGRGFIHVHHEIEISTIGSEYVVDPVNDLKPLCPNCHAMIHRKSPAYSIEEIKNVRSKVVKPT